MEVNLIIWNAMDPAFCQGQLLEYLQSYILGVSGQPAIFNQLPYLSEISLNAGTIMGMDVGVTMCMRMPVIMAVIVMAMISVMVVSMAIISMVMVIVVMIITVVVIMVIAIMVMIGMTVHPINPHPVESIRSPFFAMRIIINVGMMMVFYTMPFFMGMKYFHGHIQARDSRFFALLYLNIVLFVKSQFFKLAQKGSLVQSQIQQRSQRHIAAYTGKAVKVQYFHANSPFLRFCSPSTSRYI